MRWNLNWHKLRPIIFIFCGCLLLILIFNRPAAEYFCQKGIDYYWSEEWSKAELCFHIALAINPWLAEAHSGLGDLFSMGDESSVVSQGSRGAEKEYRQAIRLKPDYARAHFGLGWVLNSEKEIREAIRLSPNTYRYHEVLGEFLETHKRYAEAEQEYRELLRLKPDGPETLNKLALYLDKQGRRKDARALWERLLTLETETLRLQTDPVMVQRIKQRLAEPD